MSDREHIEWPDLERPGVPHVGYRDPHEPTGSDDETAPIPTLHVGDLVQITAADNHGAFATVGHVDRFGQPSVTFIFGDDERLFGYFRHEVKLIRAAVKPGWERGGLIRSTHKFRMWHHERKGWTATQPVQCEDPLFPDGWGFVHESGRRALGELALAIHKGEAALHMKEALS